MASKPKTFHATNPADMEKWRSMSDAKDFYIILHNGINTVASIRNYNVEDKGQTVVRHEGIAGELLYQGACVPAKVFGPGVDLQRLVDLGAIREATPWEEAEVLSDFSGDAGRAGTPLAAAHVGRDAPPVNEPKSVNDAKVEKAEKHDRR